MTLINTPASIKKSFSGHKLNSAKDLDPLIEQIGNSRYVLLGEATHGTHEFYKWRAALTKRLIEEKGFNFVAVEGDWPDCYKLNRFVKCYPGTAFRAEDVFSTFRRWPTWMWANWETGALAEWMRNRNKNLLVEERAGFYGLDVYSLWESMEIVINYLKKEDPATAELAMEAFNCFEPYQQDDELYSAELNLNEGCRNEVVRLLLNVREKAHHYNHNHDPEAGLNAEINTLVVHNGEKYYHSMVSFNDQSWNVRDKHMTETLETLMNYHGPEAKTIVWEHNTHIGDARATDMPEDNLLNVGQLVREKHKDEGVVLVGFGFYEGTVIAGRIWGGKMQKMHVPKALPGSIEEILHSESAENRLLLFNNPELKSKFDKWLGHRAIGVVYRPESDRWNYVPTKLSSRYDAFIYLDKTTAVHPLHIRPDGHLVPDSYPFGI